MNKTYVFYHDDFDGHCAAAVYKFSTELDKEDVELVLTPIQYGYDPEKTFGELTKEDHVVFLDFCPERDDFSTIADLCYVTVIDHHSSRSWVKDFEDKKGVHVSFDTSKAGCELTWNFCFNTTERPMPPAVWMVGRYDVWDHSDQRVVPFVTGLNLLITDPATEDGYEFWKACFETVDCLPVDAPLEEKAKRMQWDAVMQVLNMGQIAHMYRCGLAEDREKSLHDMTIDGHKFLMLNSKLSDSYDFPTHKVTDDYFGYGWYYWDGSKWKFSLRSDNGNDLTTVEGVNGHPGAAGLAMDEFKDPYMFL